MSNPSIYSAIQKLRFLLIREEKWKWIFIVVFAIINSLMEVVTTSSIVVFSQVITNPKVGNPYLQKLNWVKELSEARIIFYMAIACGIIFLIKNGISIAEVLYQNFSIQKMNFNFKGKLLNRYTQIPYDMHLTRNSANGFNIIAGDAEQMFTSGMVSLASILSESVVFISLISVFLFLNPTLSLIVFALCLGLGLLIAKFLLPNFYRWGKTLQEASILTTQNLLQFFHAFKEVTLLRKQKSIINAYQTHSKKRARAQALNAAMNAIPRIVLEIMFVGIFVITVTYLCITHENSQYMMGILGGYLYAGFRLMPGLNRIIIQLNTFKAVIPSIERVYQEYNIEVVDRKEHITGFQFDHNILLNDVYYQYPNTTQYALSGIQLEIKKGEWLGIVGETGSGKSTLVDIILGLLHPSQGKSWVDGKYPLYTRQWHQLIGYVPQTTYLLDDTIEANIAFGVQTDKIDEVQLNQVIKAAQLTSSIDSFEKGLKTLVGERGVRLSGGERQRIAIARALYTNPSVLIFDEATASLDSDTELRLMETVRSLSHNRTVIMIAHRISTLKDCNRIVVMDKGRITNITSYENLENEKLKEYA